MILTPWKMVLILYLSTGMDFLDLMESKSHLIVIHSVVLLLSYAIYLVEMRYFIFLCAGVIYDEVVYIMGELFDMFTIYLLEVF
jgi:hypothetical protein